MPVNRNALIRYKTIDKCLQNRYRRWTLEDLIEACSEALYEYEGILKGISKRTVQLDLQMMRSDKLGYNAPIIVYENKYYTYEDPHYSITNIPLTDKDLAKLSEAVEFMKQFKGFSHFRELDGMIQKLEDHVYSQKKNQRGVIDFDKNENLKGLEYLEELYQAIIQRRAVRITYQSFRARKPSAFHFHPYLLKEFRNRWFVVGVRKRKDPIMVLALDRVLEISQADILYVEPVDFDPEAYFRDVIGVTVSPNLDPEKIVLYVNHKHAQYVVTKPLHPTQKVVGKDCDGITIELTVQHNYELEKEILGLGEGVMVLSPERLKRNITSRLKEAIDLYQSSIHEKGIDIIGKKLEHKGYAIANRIYTPRTIRQLGSLVNSMVPAGEKQLEKKIDPKAYPGLMKLVMNRNVAKIMENLQQGMMLKEAVLFQNVRDDMLNWHQSEREKKLCMLFFLEHAGMPSFSIQAIPGTHKKRLPSSEQSLVVENSAPLEIDLDPTGAVLMNTWLLRKFHESHKDKKIRFFMLYFDKK